MFVPLISKFQRQINFMRVFRYQKTIKNAKGKGIVISLLFALRFIKVSPVIPYAVNKGQESSPLEIKKKILCLLTVRE